MQDETLSPPLPARKGRSTRLVLALAVLAFIGGGTLVGWLAMDGQLARWLPAANEVAVGALPPAATPTSLPPAAQPSLASPLLTPPTAAQALGSVEARVAILEERLARLNVQAEAASGNAARAEGLLVAFATRRMIERGAPLGYLEEQLRLRFGDAQPNAVQTVIEAAKQPLTFDQVHAGLSAAAPALEQGKRDAGAWDMVRREFASLFVVRKSTPNAVTPQDRMTRAVLMLQSGRIDEAIAEVERMPGSAAAAEWIVTARRYASTQRALEQIEAAAMLEPHRLQDAAGRRVDQPSPLALPSAVPPEPEPSPAETAKAGTPTV